MKKRALIAMSGGVDSSVAAALTRDAGYECVGVMMKLFNPGTEAETAGYTCCAPDHREDAARVARQLGMEFSILDFGEEFAGRVISRFVSAYEKGETPNPCIDCNRYMKFGKLFEKAGELHCGKIVTGHYARTARDEKTGRWLLKRAANRAKDQSYVLYFLSQEQLAHIFFPLGEYESKEQVRSLAARYGFSNAEKHDSQDICFVTGKSYGDFMEAYTGKKYPEGEFVDSQGRVLGRHRGIIRYTIGQRMGLGLALPAPLYVCRKELETNRVVLSPEEGLYASSLTAGDFNWIACEPSGTPLRVTAKTRYNGKEAAAAASLLENGEVRVVFDQPQRAITPGQAVVLYDGDTVVGGGTIRRVDR